MPLVKLMGNVLLKNVRGISASSLRHCKKDSKNDNVVKKEKKKTSISVDKVFAKNDVNKSEDHGTKSEDETILILSTERGKDANIRSKLSKAYTHLTKKRVALKGTGLNLSVEIEKDKQSYDIIPPVSIPDIKIRREIEKKPFLPDFDIIKPEPSTGERIIRQEPGKVILGFIPEEWLHFFLPKTGVTGFYTFVFTFGTFLVSKELYVLEHNFYNGLGMIAICWGGFKWIGPKLANYLDKEVDKYEGVWVKSLEDQKAHLIESINNEQWMQYQSEGNLLLLDAKRENIALQLEDEYRKRQMQVYEEVKRRLDCQVEIFHIYKRIQHKNLLDYVIREVSKSVTPDMQDKLFHYSIDHLVRELKKEDDKK